MENCVKYEKNQVEALTALISSLDSRIDGLVKKVEELSARCKKAEFYDLDDLSKLLKVSKRTLSNWRMSGLLPLRKLGNNFFILKDTLAAIIAENPKMQKGGLYE